MEQREHARIQIPLVVEVSHPSIGKQRTTARDISEGGVFVMVPGAKVRVGAKLKIQLLNLLDIDNQPTPTVDMQVKRITDDGLGLVFTNRTGEHLWASAKRLRDELEIGRDYFQIYQSIVIQHASRGVLLVQQNGKWLLPGHYLIVGEQAVLALREYVDTAIGLELKTRPQPLAAQSEPNVAVPQAATFSLIYGAQVEAREVRLSKQAPYKEAKWLTKPKDVKETTFVSEFQRDITAQTLKSLLADGNIDV